MHIVSQMPHHMADLCGLCRDLTIDGLLLHGGDQMDM